MIVAIPVWQGRVSPVFDVASQLLLLELSGEVETARRQEALPEERPERRVARLQALRIETLICGAISRPLETLLVAGRIKVIPRVCGDVDEVVRAYLADQLPDDRFAMPGCCCPKHPQGRGVCRRRGWRRNP